MARRSKKAKSNELSEVPDYESFTDADLVDLEVTRHKELLVKKDFVERRVKEDKKDYVGALNDQLKELKEEREHEMGIISALQDRKKLILAPGFQATVIPIRSRTS